MVEGHGARRLLDVRMMTPIVPDVRAAQAALRSKGVEFTHQPRRVSGPCGRQFP